MPLTVLAARQTPSDRDLLRYFLQAQGLLAAHLSEPLALSCGTAHINPKLSKVYLANHVRNAALPEGLAPAEALADIQGAFSAAGTRCAYIAPNPHDAPARNAILLEHLAQAGWKAQVEEVWCRRRSPVRPVMETAEAQIIPGRASYRHAEALARECSEELWPEAADQLAEAWMTHMDDPHWDVVLALQSGRAVGRVGILSSGEVGLIEYVYITPDRRGKGLGRTLMSRALENCARSLFRHVFLSVAPGNAVAKSLYARMGFEKIADYATWRAPHTLA